MYYAQLGTEQALSKNKTKQKPPEPTKVEVNLGKPGLEMIVVSQATVKYCSVDACAQLPLFSLCRSMAEEQAFSCIDY